MYRVSIGLYKHKWKFGEQETMWKHEPQASVSTAFSGSPKLSRKKREKGQKETGESEFYSILASHDGQ